MNNVLTIDTRELIGFTKRLENLSKTALPNVVRKTLNDAAMDVKKTTMPESSHVFTQRQKNFFTANSRVEFAQNSSSISNMQSSVGFMEKGLKGENNYSVKDLEQQEAGGKIAGRSFIPTKNARIGNSNTGLVKAQFRLSSIMEKIANAADFTGKNDRQKFIHAASFVGKGGFVIGTGEESNFVYYIAWIGRTDKRHSVSKRGLGAAMLNRKGNTVVNAIPIYSIEGGRNVNVEGTHFMEKASEKTTKKMEKFFIINAEERFKRVLKK